jgi:nucleotide-binding universal stress UspA family protein
MKAGPYRHIVVPLDGSLIAEAALDQALPLARLSGAKVTLLEIVPPLDQVIERNSHPIFIDEQWEARRSRALRYLKGVARQDVFSGVEVEVAVELGPVAETILDWSSSHGVDAIVIATHGLSGIRRWVLGSVAQKVLSRADRTVILVRSRPSSPVIPVPRRPGRNA